MATDNSKPIEIDEIDREILDLLQNVEKTKKRDCNQGSRSKIRGKFN